MAMKMVLLRKNWIPKPWSSLTVKDTFRWGEVHLIKTGGNYFARNLVNFMPVRFLCLLVSHRAIVLKKETKASCSVP